MNELAPVAVAAGQVRESPYGDRIAVLGRYADDPNRWLIRYADGCVTHWFSWTIEDVYPTVAERC